jgi:hypothetical protein
VVDDGEVTDDLAGDMAEVLTSFCARLYGRRSARNRALKALRCALERGGRWPVRTLAPALIAAPLSGARIRTRPRLNADDEQVLRAV